MSREPLTWYGLRWPREVTPEQVGQLVRLLATTAGTPVVIEAIGQHGMVRHRLALPLTRAGSVAAQLRAALPGLALEAHAPRSLGGLSRAVQDVIQICAIGNEAEFVIPGFVPRLLGESPCVRNGGVGWGARRVESK